MMKLHENRNSGFTLVEALATVAILIILLGLSAVGVARWQDPLKITELDNAARAIYMAAENRAVLLQNSGAAASLLTVPTTPAPGDLTSSSATVTQGGKKGTVSLCVLSDTTTADILNELLPVGVIDPTLKEGHFYILYDRSTYHVFEVFYAEKSFLLPEKEEDMETLRGSRSERVSYYREDTANRCLVGHYAGGLAGPIGAKPLPTPGVEVSITNGNELTLTVKYTIPKGLPSGVKYSPSVKLDYLGTSTKEDLLSVDATTGVFKYLNDGRLTQTGDFNVPSAENTVTYTWVLDSLAQDDSGNFTKQFKGLFSKPDAIAFGRDFTVNASLELSADGYIKSNNAADGTNNSLFAKTLEGGDPNTAYITNLRHLQNLDSDSSGAKGKKEALQLYALDAKKVKDNKDTVLNSAYEFRPIANNDLQSYNGQGKTISNLTVTGNSANGKNGAGLFGSVGDAGFKFQNVRLADSKVTAGESAWGTVQPTGALLGYFWSSVSFEDCQVVNTEVLGTSSLAGGMAGQMWAVKGKTVTFKNCKAEGLTVNSWSSYAGGLLGWSGGGGSAEFTDCTVGTDGSAFTVSGSNAGGLLGNAGGEATFTNCTVGNGDAPQPVSISGWQYSGGVVGNLGFSGSFEKCKVFNVEVGLSSEAGGIAGRATRASLKDCSTKNLNVKGNLNAGGLVGGATDTYEEKDNDGKIINIVKGSLTFEGCSANNVIATVETGSVGGLVGNSQGGKFDSCTTTNANVSVVNGRTSEAGGLVGSATGDSFRLCSTTNATIREACFSGGLVGSSKKGGSFDGCTTTNVRIPSIKGDTTYVGGLVGFSIEGGTFTGCKVINAQMVPEGYATYAGGMVGSAAYPALNNCQVYWDQSELTQFSKESYQVNGVTAGGLVGTIDSSGTIRDSFAATLVKGSVYAGGLVGHIGPAATSVAVEHSYADCYIYNPGTESWASAGGLIGLKESGDTTLNLKNVYATGFIKGKGNVAAGLCGGEVSVKTNAINAYAAMHYDGTYTFIYPLAAALAWGQGNNCYWLKYNGFPSYTHHKDDDAKTYAEMSVPAFVNTMGSAFTKPVETHPYWNTGTYPFPALSGLPHYGDWPTS